MTERKSIDPMDKIRDAFRRIWNAATNQPRQVGDRELMQIPVNEEIDADCVMHRALDELEQLRAENAKLKEGARYFDVACSSCSWSGSSREAAGFESIADTGDFSEGRCPQCDSNILDIEELQSNLSTLRAQLRWRKFPEEKPDAEECLIWCPPGLGKRWNATYSGLLQDGDIWLPLPPSPEEGSDGN